MSVNRGKVLRFKHIDITLAAWLVCGAAWVVSVGVLVATG